MPVSKHLILFLLLYLLTLLGVGGYLFWPEPQRPPLGVASIRLGPEGDRILLEGNGFSPSTQVSLSLDVSNSRFLRHSVATWGRGGDMVRVGHFAYATCREMGLLVLDLVEPQRPRIVGYLELPGQARNLVVAAGVAYVACDRAGLALVDVTEPDSPRLLSTIPELAMAQGLAVRGGRLYVALFSTGVAPALAVVDVFDPREPKLLDRQPLPGKPLGLALWNQSLLVAAGDGGLLTLDLGQGLPRLASQLPLPGLAHSVLVVGDHAYVTCTSEGLAVVALRTEGQKLLTHLPLAGIHTRQAAEAGRLYLLDASGGGQVLAIEHPSQPRSLGSFPAPRSTFGVAALGPWVYLNTVAQGIQVLDLSDPAPLQIAEQVAFDASIVALALDRDRDLLAVTSSSGKLHLLTGLAGGGLRRLGTHPLLEVARSLQLKGGFAFVHSKRQGLEVLDIRDPEAPVRRSAVDTSDVNPAPGATGGENSLVVAEHWGGFVDAGGGLWLFDIAADGAAQPRPGPALPQPLGDIAMGEDLLYASMRTGGGIWPLAMGPDGKVHRVYPLFQLPAQQIKQLAALGTVVVAACGLEGVAVVDFGDPAAPRLLAVLPLPISADHLRLQGTTAYIGASGGGLQSMDLSDPARPLLGGLLSDGLFKEGFAVSGSRALLAGGSAGLVTVPLPQLLQPLSRDGRQLSLALPPIDLPGFYTLHLTDGQQSLTLPGTLKLPRR